MIWQSCENLRAATLNDTMAEQLCRYLSGKEGELCRRLQGATRIFPELPPQLTISSNENHRLNDTIDDLGKRLHRLSTMPHALISPEDWQTAIDEINVSFWSYIEIIETSLAELFQQVDQIGFEQWTIDLSDAATQIKDELTHRLDDVIWGVRRLDRQLNSCYSKVVKTSRNWKFLHLFSSVFKNNLDPAIDGTAKKCLKFLSFRYGKFVERYVGYLELYDDAERPLRKTQNFRVLSSLDANVQERYKQIHFLLSLWQLNRKARTLPRAETVRAVRSLATYESIFQMFREYLSTIRSSIFDKSRLIKKGIADNSIDNQSNSRVIEQLVGIQNELHSLASAADQYRHFLLQTNPSRRAKFRLTRWFGSRETKQTRALTGLVQESEQLDNLCKKFKTSLEQGESTKSKLTSSLDQEITHHLHEMGQPLASKVMMRRHAKAVLLCLQKIDEVGSYHSGDVEFISRVLCKLMRSDWKYHVLYDIPGFQPFFQTHINLINVNDDRQHLARYNTFKKVFQQLNQWIDNGDLVKHSHEIELDINDTKSLLQDFLGQVQQLSQPLSSGEEDKRSSNAIAMKQLLDYLHLFGSFFHKLQMSDPDQRQLRRRFLFVDQYFDAIESSLQRK